MSRMEQVNELLRGELANLISREITLDNGLITIIYVKCSPNLNQATVGISVLPETMSGTALRALRKHSSGFSGILKKKISLKFIPKFRWVVDSQERYAVEIDNAINEINKRDD
ncbi:hypothetical protein A2331_05600 [Candidatus Falkowbacteria bacterium RIFOXYB2_FULL_34_18]|uniref:Ribosome-binding factor A n=1 Tax=Candidatus Falkowbacteria bacterium RIFOXYD2_FULL_34_120 TaxID=1798007 RepID=A0A1F5TR12_9BACT|nr:MAG: hypothetical protein A2331_05600 [Candidatus Falkowbacteria bacterium RIFOXYB2_FULL_34_18]OGF29817.1 MAG: hypothetical protein A2500_01430 [Candidatus Falkowbacteria bacterium RIFOXYC12_FULL_34_55]OGF37068.1 MAG: hypothetical protein A2466_05775 [Candidatus Falkowbacteria bacterium RIFOXYC2_FULL_34_220]OGF39260.1 MAG: hypothetical protein A2515_00985 [Candidatus Falkowbacteria bacterium RIFOXYD12_FULL_34_57]OGF41365.1 MAG: hypothetical protein A2531_07195 [Candidatus Falkowbacteria bact